MVGFLNFYIYEIEFYLCTLNLDGFLDSDGTRRLKLRYDFVCLHFAWVNCFVLCMDIFLNGNKHRLRNFSIIVVFRGCSATKWIEIIAPNVISASV